MNETQLNLSLNMLMLIVLCEIDKIWVMGSHGIYNLHSGPCPLKQARDKKFAQ